MLGPLMLDLNGLQLTQEEKEILAHPIVGGIILFSRNFDSIEQLQCLMQEIRKATKQRLLVAVDHEGGRVQRFREGFTTLPAARLISDGYQEDALAAKKLAQDCGWLMAAELIALDIDISFAPVLDLDKGISEVIGNRSFHSNPLIVTELAEAYIQGMQQAGMAATGKHFPGHGSIAADSHTHIPIDDRSYEAICREDLQPFVKLAQQLAGIMPAHIIYSQVDKNPAGFSRFWLQEVLRQQLKFSGVIFSDDLAMAGATVVGSFADRADLALSAGCDMILVCNQRDAAIAVIESLSQYKHTSLYQARLENLHGKRKFSWQELHQQTLWKQINYRVESCREQAALLS